VSLFRVPDHSLTVVARYRHTAFLSRDREGVGLRAGIRSLQPAQLLPEAEPIQISQSGGSRSVEEDEQFVQPLRSGHRHGIGLPCFPAASHW
jgi:hypothetical protein